MRPVAAVLAVLVVLAGGGVAVAAFVDTTESTGNVGRIAADWSLEQGACVRPGGAGGCATARGIQGVTEVVVEPGGDQVYAVAIGSEAVTSFARNATTGALTQLAGEAGCSSSSPGASGGTGQCAEAQRLQGAGDVAVSGDGRHVYVAAANTDAVLGFARDDATGALTPAGCVGPAGCGAGAGGLDGPSDVVVSPDGEHVYATGQDSSSVHAFARDATTGALTHVSCLDDTGAGACATASRLAQPAAVRLTTDGSSAYVASPSNDTILSLDRDGATGALTHGSCVSSAAVAGCDTAHHLDQVRAVAVSPGGGSVYGVSAPDNALTVFRRASGGALTQAPGDLGCFRKDPVAGQCRDAARLGGPEDAEVAPVGADVFAVARGDTTVARFFRGANGDLARPPGSDTCVGTAAPCETGTNLDGVRDVALSPQGEHLYVAADTGSAIVVFGT